MHVTLVVPKCLNLITANILDALICLFESTTDSYPTEIVMTKDNLICVNLFYRVIY